MREEDLFPALGFGIGGILLGLVLVVILGVLHFLPSIIGRKRPDILLIFLVNLLAGWSVIGWFVALYLALRNTTTTVPFAVGAAPTASLADELSKLRDLREQGVLTADEFEAQKASLLRSR